MYEHNNTQPFSKNCYTAVLPIPIHKDIKREANNSSFKTAQMFAHDVRKPFTHLKVILKLISHMNDPNEIRRVIKKFIPDLERSIVSVDNLLEDMLESGKCAKLITESTIPQIIIETSLNEVFKMYPHADISFHYNFKHHHTVNIDTKKILRVFSNIIDNAAQAMKMRGEIWFYTREKKEDGHQFIEFSIKNSGSFIPKEDRNNVFEEFFTKDKKNGTGLGLAIVKKIIQEHGGKICCHSKRNKSSGSEFTEFVFTLPMHTACDHVDIKSLPKSAKEILNI